MSNINTLVEKRNQLMSEAQRFALEGNMTEERKATFNKFLADAEALETLIAREQEARVSPATAREITNPLAPDAKSELRDALTAYAKTGEKRSITTTGLPSGSINGGLLIPQTIDSKLFNLEKMPGQLLSVVRVLKTDTGNQIKVASVDDTANLFSVVGESVQVTPDQNDPSIYGQFSQTDVMQSGLITVSRAEIQDANWSIDNLLDGLVATRWARSLEKFIVTGNGSGNNIVALAPAVVSTTTASATAPSFSDYSQLYAQLEPAYQVNGVFAMNSATKAETMSITDSYGRPIFLVGGSGQSSVQGGGFDSIFGKRVVYNQYLPSYAAGTAGQNAVLFGDFAAQYTMRVVTGSYELLRLNERFADQGLVGFIAYGRAGSYNNFNGNSNAKPVIALTSHS